FFLDNGEEVPLVYVNENRKGSQRYRWLLTDPKSKGVKAIVRWAVALNKKQITQLPAEPIEMEQASNISVFFTELERFLENRRTIWGWLTPEEKRLLAQIEIVRVAEYKEDGDKVSALRTDVDIYTPPRGDKKRELLWSYRRSDAADKNFIRNDQSFGFYRIPGGDMKVVVRTPDGTFLIQALGYQLMPGSFNKEWIDFRIRMLNQQQADALVKAIPFWQDQTALTPKTFVENVGAHLDILKPGDLNLFRRMGLTILEWLIRDPVLNRYKDVVKARLSKDAFALSDDRKYFVVKTHRGQEVPLFKLTDNKDQPLEIAVGPVYPENSSRLTAWVTELRNEMLRRQTPRRRQIVAVPVLEGAKNEEQTAVARFLWYLGVFLEANGFAGSLNPAGKEIFDRLEIKQHLSRKAGQARTRDGKMVAQGKASYGDVSVYLKAEESEAPQLVFQYSSDKQRGPDVVAADERFSVFRLLNSENDVLIVRFGNEVFQVVATDVPGGSDWSDQKTKQGHEFDITQISASDLDRLIGFAQPNPGDAAMLAGREVTIDKETGAQLIKPANPEELKQWQEKFRRLKEEFAVWWSGGDLEKFMRVFFEKLVFDFGKFLTQHKFTNLKGQNDLFKNIFGHDEFAELVRHVLEKISEDPETMMEILGDLDGRDHQGTLPDGEDDDDVLSLLNYLKTTTETTAQQMERAYRAMRFMFGNNMDSLVDFLYQFGYTEKEGAREAVLKEWEEVRGRTARASQYVLMNMFPHAIGFRMYRGTSKIEASGPTVRYDRPAYFSLFREGPEGTYQKKTGQLLVANVPLESVRMFHPLWMVDQRSADYGQVLVSAGEYALVDDTGENADLERGEDRLTISVKDMILGMLKPEDQTAVMKIDDLRLSFSDAETLEKQVFYLRIILTELLSNARERGMTQLSLTREENGALLFRVVDRGEIDWPKLLKTAGEASGFGSAMIRGFAQLLGGEYDIRSSQGETTAEVSIPVSDEFQIVDAAMMTNVNAAASTEIDGKTARKVGGIDLDSRKMDLRTRGEQVEFVIPPGFEHVDPNVIPGFTPLILNIVPAADLPMFFGSAAGQRVSDDG
ncbi:MAG TPA: ATP-binding protein, partial [Candidatus Bathyarchaeia archaeon]|nr:ATP-binding protein [Candidatus Bathyarchaeia archaeon]